MAQYKIKRRIVRVNANGTQTSMPTSKTYADTELNGIKTLEAVSMVQVGGDGAEFRFNPGATISGLPA